MSEQDRESEPVPSPPAQTSDDRVILRVGDRRFTTTKSTLTDGSDWFRAFFSGRWNHALMDGAYFIDADGDLFEHILRYLRRKVFPIFYDNAKGHDHAMYLALMKEAEYYQIEPLRRWIEDKSYRTAVVVWYSVKVCRNYDGSNELFPSNHEIQHIPFFEEEQVYICPRGIALHRGRPGACGKQCKKVQGDTEDIYVTEEVLKMVVIEKRTTILRDSCTELADWSDQDTPL
ncbi:hypothetical protein W97_07039 [Coniosporium apollinis CBS 100218]|uniref:BTB domain-containing protein n=1 Tax=Coniosporium apollinis (strain CBS 100218) TaxID=1168221 RepID=R7Z169_CONA1|nr:uncharacterized protein W97_07039 [Coniosporium apollinis CBS 100218]EON67784.1 hypothetical protein W97_07039 [Coniosporium apollinis CBS 100218]